MHIAEMASLFSTLSQDEARRYRWIQNVYEGDFRAASEALIERRALDNERTALPETKWAFCMAKLANHVVLKEAPGDGNAKVREKKVNNTLELIGVQAELLHDCSDSLRSTKKLLSQATDNACRAMAEGGSDQLEKAARSLYLGLLVCTAMESERAQQEGAISVWQTALEFNRETLWEPWIEKEQDLTLDSLAKSALDTTVFGLLLQECADDDSLEDVTFSDVIGNEVISGMGLKAEQVAPMHRLLNAVKSFKNSNSLADEEMMEVQPDDAVMVM